jgi:hypothetical protein
MRFITCTFCQVKEDKMSKTYSKNGEKKNTYTYIIGGKSKEKRPLGRPRHRRMDNIKMDYRGIG